MKIDIAVVDYGMGNLRSVSKALEHVAPHLNIVVTDQAEQIHAADKVVFPGQGAMPDCMRETIASVKASGDTSLQAKAFPRHMYRSAIAF